MPSRFLAAFAALVPGQVTFVGDEHMAKRPIADLVGALEQMGVEVDCPTGTRVAPDFFFLSWV